MSHDSTPPEQRYCPKCNCWWILEDDTCEQPGGPRLVEWKAYCKACTEKEIRTPDGIVSELGRLFERRRDIGQEIRALVKELAEMEG